MNRDAIKVRIEQLESLGKYAATEDFAEIEALKLKLATNKHKQQASILIGRAYFCAMDFETEMRDGYLQCCFENWVNEKQPSQEDAAIVTLLLKKQGFDW